MSRAATIPAAMTSAGADDSALQNASRKEKLAAIASSLNVWDCCSDSQALHVASFSLLSLCSESFITSLQLVNPSQCPSAPTH